MPKEKKQRNSKTKRKPLLLLLYNKYLDTSYNNCWELLYQKYNFFKKNSSSLVSKQKQSYSILKIPV